MYRCNCFINAELIRRRRGKKCFLDLRYELLIHEDVQLPRSWHQEILVVDGPWRLMFTSWDHIGLNICNTGEISSRSKGSLQHWHLISVSHPLFPFRSSLCLGSTCGCSSSSLLSLKGTVLKSCALIKSRRCEAFWVLKMRLSQL